MTGTRHDAGRPGWSELFAELPAAFRLLAARFRPAAVPAAGGTPVIVIPGLLTGDSLTRPLRSALNAAGFHAVGWNQGFNWGARRRKFQGTLDRIDRLFLDTRRKPVLLGWSLGGLYARELAKRRPDAVALVMTLGAPFSHGLRRNNAWKLYEAVNDHDIDHPPIAVAPAEKPRVHTMAFWSPNDGIVAPASAAGEDGEVDERIELDCRHLELVSDPEALDRIVSRLSRWEREQNPG
jgi:pimeloyl-ACP methyl ester carboxylesterase